jgi:hypothetical protein
MTIAHIPPFAKRTTQGSKLSSSQHDAIHEDMRQTINALIDQLNANSNPSALPAGVSLEWNGSTLPTGRYLWENGVVLSRALYPELFAAIGTSFNTGGETGSEFRLPNRMAKVAVCSNPMGGQTDATLSTYTFATYGGEENNNYTPTVTINTATLTATPTGTVALTPYTPSGTISVSNITAAGTIVVSSVNPSGTIAIDPHTPSGSVTVDSATLATTPTGTVDVILNQGTITGTGTASVSGAACSLVQLVEGGTSVIDCDSPLVVSISTIAAGLTTNFSVASATFTGVVDDLSHSHAATFTGVEDTLTATFTGSPTTPTATFTGTPVSATGTFTGVASTQTASFTGASQNLNHSHTGSVSEFEVSTIQPYVVKNFIITY